MGADLPLGSGMAAEPDNDIYLQAYVCTLEYMKSVDLTVRVPAHIDLPISERITDAIHREEVISWDIDRSKETLSFVSIVVGDQTVAEAEATDTAAITRFETTPIDEDTFYGYVETDLTQLEQSFADLFEVPDVVVIPPMVYTGGDAFSMTVLGTEAALRDFLSDVPSTFDVHIERLSEHRRRTESMVGQLTVRQFSALETAAKLGYFEVPREASLAEVAAELECSESTASTLVRTAVEKLVDGAIDY